jgi:hypothetical protein
MARGKQERDRLQPIGLALHGDGPARPRPMLRYPEPYPRLHTPMGNLDEAEVFHQNDRKLPLSSLLVAFEVAAQAYGDRFLVCLVQTRGGLLQSPDEIGIGLLADNLIELCPEMRNDTHTIHQDVMDQPDILVLL